MPVTVLRSRTSSSPEISVENGAGAGVPTVVRETSLRRVDQGVVLVEDLSVSAAGDKAGRVPILRGLSGYAAPARKVRLWCQPEGRHLDQWPEAEAILRNIGVRDAGRRANDDADGAGGGALLGVAAAAERHVGGGEAGAGGGDAAGDGAEGAADTRIGGWMHKGISGGQRRRVSICMEILTRPALLFLDEPTSGLDSAASFHVVSRIAWLARREGMTVVAAVHQPSTEVFGLFHGLCLLAYGKTVFFGPAAETNQFFALSGFPCPSLMNPSDHFLRTINKDFDNDIEEGLSGKKTTTAENIDALASSYKSSVHMDKVTRQIVDIRGIGGDVVKMDGQQPSFLTQSFVLTKRSFINMYRDLGYYWLRFAIYIALCLCCGTIFYDIGQNYGSIQARGSMLMFVGAFLTFMAIGGFLSSSRI
ncbi:hypothetical protein ZWY2020_041210 [Hordeum vulgare]|nr:hypothetical protein ZWY2020_041210 [Hordeum vulgare]